MHPRIFLYLNPKLFNMKMVTIRESDCSMTSPGHHIPHEVNSRDECQRLCTEEEAGVHQSFFDFVAIVGEKSESDKSFFDMGIFGGISDKFTFDVGIFGGNFR